MALVISARPYEDEDDCLRAAADDARSDLGLRGWDLDERWADDQRETIALTIPMPAHGDARGWERLRSLDCLSCTEVRS